MALLQSIILVVNKLFADSVVYRLMQDVLPTVMGATSSELRTLLSDTGDDMPGAATDIVVRIN